MKKALFFLSAISLLFTYSSCKDKVESGSKPNNNTTESSKKIKPLKLAFVNLDSLQNGLDLFQTKKKEFEQKEKAITNELSRMERQIQNEYAAFQRKIQNKNISQVQAEATQKRLGNLQTRLAKKQQSLTTNLMKKQAAFNADFLMKINTFFELYNKDKNYDFILTEGQVKTMLYVNPKHDITTEVTKEMNDWLKKGSIDKAIMKTIEKQEAADTSK